MEISSHKVRSIQEFIIPCSLLETIPDVIDLMPKEPNPCSKPDIAPKYIT